MACTFERKKFDFTHPSTNFMRKARRQKSEPANHLICSQAPAKHVSTALQTFLRAGPFWGYSKISLKKSRNVRKCRTISSTSQARYLRPCKHLCGLGHCVVYEKRLDSRPENCEMFVNSSNVLYKCLGLAFEKWSTQLRFH